MGTPASTGPDACGLLSLAVALSLLLWCHAKPDGSLILCIPSEREALLSFKRDLIDPSNRLSSWVEEEQDPHTDCCAWSGVVCHNSTGHVLQLRLAGTRSPPSIAENWVYYDVDKTKVLRGKLNPSLLNLKHLTHLDLSWNDFQGVPIPTFFGSLENLRYLNLSYGGFGGAIPHQLRNLSSLQSLDLNSFDDDYMLGTSSLEWAAGLTSLQFLGLSGVDLSRAHDWLQVTSRLLSLQQLILLSCYLPYTPTSLPAMNFSSLSVLDLSRNSLSSVPGWIFTLPALTSLSLSYNYIEGAIPVGLRNLTALTSLHLLNNQLNSTFPKWLCDLHKLEDLNLRRNSLQGRIPEAIGNMTSLTTLDLTDNRELQGGGWLFKSLGNLGRLRRVYLSGLKFGRNTFVKDVKSLSGGLIELYLSGAQLSGQFSELVDHFAEFKNLARLHLSNNSLCGPIPESMGTLSSLKSLGVSYNQLAGPIPASIRRLSSLQSLDVSHNQLVGSFPVSIGTLSLLEILYLSGNQLAGPIPTSIGRLSTLQCLDVSHNQLAGSIPTSIGRLSSLEILDLSDNQLAGTIPTSIGRLSSLQSLDVSHNQLNGTLPTSLGQLINLRRLDTSYNPMTGDVSEIHFANLTKLYSLTALENRFCLKVRRPNWVPPFQLLYLSLDSWQIGQFPLWLPSQTNLIQLRMSHSEITSEIPNWFWNSFPNLQYLNLSQNQIHGNLPPSSIIFPEATIIDLSSNQFNCVLPLISSRLVVLNLANNYFFGSISPFLCHKPHERKRRHLEYLNLQNNHLSGEVSDCWRIWTSLSIIRAGNNNLTGNLSSSIGFLYNLQSLHFENNHLQGEIPTSIGSCVYLISMDLGENNFVGIIPTWIGKQLALLKLLRLRSNRFDGKIPDQICGLTSLQVLDLAHNNLSGSIPLCFNKFKAMITVKKNTTIPIYVDDQGNLPESASLMWKGIIFEYNKILGLLTYGPFK